MEGLAEIRDFLWGFPMLLLLLGTGVVITVRLNFLQVRKLLYALWLVVFKSRKSKTKAKGDISPFQALTTALAATVGTGNIAGVATAIATGGPGAVFWLWVSGFFGLATKFAEVVLAVKYRVTARDGTVSGGPMYYMSNALKMKVLAAVFSFGTVIASITSGSMVQANSVVLAVSSTFEIYPAIISMVLMVSSGVVILGGIKRVGKITEGLVPLMTLLYVGGGAVVLYFYRSRILEAFSLIFTSAFRPMAAVGGFGGAALMEIIRNGMARGVFANEAGVGSSPIAHAAAKTDSPVRQGLVAMVEVFINTFIVCTLTSLVIIATGNWKTGLTSSELTAVSFNDALPGLGSLIVVAGLILFAFSTILGWSYYGEKGFQFIFGTRLTILYRLAFIFSIYFGGVSAIQTVWYLADVANCLMAIPNLLALFLLSGTVVKITKAELDQKAKN
ncbi:MAG TPA: sodium:alanine symporter family protein [Clostridia bacterium]|nr:sodium:alanine symporter family protein [Clostridia bacterium]